MLDCNSYSDGFQTAVARAKALTKIDWFLTCLHSIRSKNGNNNNNHNYNVNDCEKNKTDFVTKRSDNTDSNAPIITNVSNNNFYSSDNNNSNHINYNYNYNYNCNNNCHRTTTSINTNCNGARFSEDKHKHTFENNINKGYTNCKSSQYGSNHLNTGINQYTYKSQYSHPQVPRFYNYDHEQRLVVNNMMGNTGIMGGMTARVNQVSNYQPTMYNCTVRPHQQYAYGTCAMNNNSSARDWINIMRGKYSQINTRQKFTRLDRKNKMHVLSVIAANIMDILSDDFGSRARQALHELLSLMDNQLREHFASELPPIKQIKN